MTDQTPAVIMVAPNGARKTPADHPALPVTPDAVARTAAECAEAGASALHLHVRDAAMEHSLDPELYRAAIAAVRREAGAGFIIQITTEAVGRCAPDQQMSCVRDVRPEAASLAVRELCPDAESEAGFGAFCEWMGRERVAPQFILYDAADVERFRDLRRRGVIALDRPFVLYVLGRYAAGQQSDPVDVLPFIHAAGDDALDWAVCAFGRREAACAAAVALDGHARVGFENNMLLVDGRTAPDNAALVAQAVRAAELIGRPVASPAAARQLLGVGP